MRDPPRSGDASAMTALLEIMPDRLCLAIAPPDLRAYNSPMMDATQPCDAGETWREDAFDLTRGVAAYTGSALVRGLSKVISRHPDADIGNAFNHKQVACKLWARDTLRESCGGRFADIWIVGGWYGVLAAMFFDDPRFDLRHVASIDIDPEVGAIATTLNGFAGERFEAITADMYEVDYRGGRPDLVINTSCEHIADLPAWLSLLAPGTRVLLQSNNYFSEPTHINCVPSLQAFVDMAALKSLDFSGELPMKKYTRYMLIGTV